MTIARGNNFAKPGFTLLEVLLSLTLVGIVLLILGTMIHIHLRVVDGSRTDLQDARLAHSLLKRIGDDLRGTIRYEPVDPSVLNLTSKTFTQAAAIATAAANGGSSSSTDGSSTSGGTQGSGSSSGASGGSSGGASSGSSGTGSSGSGTSGTSGASGSSSTGGSTGSSTNSSGSSTSSTQSTTPPVTPAIPGLYGDQYSLQIDVARLPRLDEYAGEVSSDGSQLVPPSDVKSISYYLGTSGGLMKQELHRAAALYAEENGGEGIQGQDAQALAPEVSDVTFSYFDGTTMQSSWDSTEQGGLPIAVQIELAIPAGASAGKPDNQDVRIYTMLVQLENGGLSPTVPDPSTSSSSDPSSQPSTSGDSSSSGTDGSGSSSSGGTSGASRTGKRGAASTQQGGQGGGKGGGQGGGTGKGAGQGGATGKGAGAQGGTSGKTGTGSGTTSPASQQFKAAGPSSGGASGGAAGGGSPSQGVAPGGAN